MTNKCLVQFDVYECSEVVNTRIATVNKDKKELDIHFDTIEEAQTYCEKYSNEFEFYYPVDFFETGNSGINYKELKVQWDKEEESRKRQLKSCPFCGNSPKRVGEFAECSICKIKIKDMIWNRRK